MSPDKMIYMANQIATFFRSQPGDAQAARVAAHLKDFWEPRMLAQFQRIIAGEEAVGLAIDPIVRDAAAHLKQMA